MCKTYSSRNPITTFAGVDSFTFCPRRIAMIVSLWSPVRFANLRSEVSFIASSKLGSRLPVRRNNEDTHHRCFR